MNIHLSIDINPILKYRLASKTTEECQKYNNFQTLAYCSSANFRFQAKPRILLKKDKTEALQ
uniref:Uncharacterized protein n=1 Tax=Romanomermis culicivorax TaxID=13658 RepID=A0A915KRH0_ROMCU